MNLRKLLCGLLALCLLLTMAPAALMEEAPVEEVVVELGGEIEAPEETLVEGEAVAADDGMYQYEPGMTDLRDNMEMALDVNDDPVTLDVYAPLAGKPDNTYKKVATVDGAKGDEQITITPNKVGKTVITVKLQEKDYNGKDKFTITLTVSDAKAASVVKLFTVEEDGEGELSFNLVEGEDDYEIQDGAVMLVAAVFSEANKDSDDYEDRIQADEDFDGYTFLWTVTNKSKVTRDNGADWLLLTPKAEGKVKVTATAKGTNKKGSYTLNFIDSYKPQSLKLVADQYGDITEYNSKAKTWSIDDFATLKETKDVEGGYITGEEGPYDTLVELTAIANPDVETPITWSIDNKNVAKLLRGQKTYTGMLNYLVPLKPGKVTITAKTYNGKKASITIELLDMNAPVSADIYMADVSDSADLGTRDFKASDAAFDYPADPTEVVELYSLDKDDKIINTTLALKALVRNGMSTDEDKDANIIEDYSALTWSSSKASVATIKKDKEGYATLVCKKTGTTKITVKTKNGKTDSFTLKVVDHHSPIAVYFVDDDGVTIKTFKMKAGEYAYLNPVLVAVEDPAFEKVTFKSHHTSIATVNSNGLVHALRKGNVKIDAIANNGKKATITVKISK